MIDDQKLADFLEAAYSLESSDDEWLNRVLVAADALCGHEAEPVSLYHRLAGHLSTAYRCRRRLAAVDPVAPNTPVAEAVVDASRRSLQLPGVTESRRARERIRSRLGAPDSDRHGGRRAHGADARQLARAVGGSRWTLIDSFEESGRRYVLARENQTSTHNFALLTDRERQIVVHAALGLSNKQIAETLGISDATVRVLMARAAARFGVRTRKALLAHHTLLALRPNSV